MMTGRDRHNGSGIDPITVRLAIFGLIMVVVFVALFSRLWYLQVLAAPDYRELAKENRVRRVHSEPPRGRIVDRNGKVLVGNTISTAVTIDHQELDKPWKKRAVLKRLSKVLDVSRRSLGRRLEDETVSPYKPVPVEHNIPSEVRDRILENQEDYFGAVDVEKIPVRVYPENDTGAHILGYTREISEENLKSPHFKNARPKYAPGDIVGRDGVEYVYDRFLRGQPQVKKVIVNSTGEVLHETVVKDEEPGDDLVLYLDARIQKLTEDALEAGIMASRGSYQAPAGAAVVMDPETGGIVAMASYPTYDPRIFADGTLSQKEYNKLGAKTKNDPDDDAFINRAIQGQRAPGSTFKIITAGAALATGVADVYTTLDCPGSKLYPPPGVVEAGAYQPFNNWTSADFGYIGFSQSLEISCDTFYYELGWRMETAFGQTYGGDGSEQFQKYARLTGLGHETGIDLPNEGEGRIPDMEWCREIWEATKKDRLPTCGTKRGPQWLPGYTINMSIGQGDVLTTPLQMAVATSAIANGGYVMRPSVAYQIARPNDKDVEEPVKEFEPFAKEQLPLDETELAVIRQGLEDVVSSGAGTANTAFAGFPVSAFPVAGKTGTAELGETDLQDAWFISYAPADDPRYTIVVYVEKAGHGGESAAPIARQIFEGIFEIDQETSVQLGVDSSG